MWKVNRQTDDIQNNIRPSVQVCYQLSFDWSHLSRDRMVATIGFMSLQRWILCGQWLYLILHKTVSIVQQLSNSSMLKGESLNASSISWLNTWEDLLATFLGGTNQHFRKDIVNSTNIHLTLFPVLKRGLFVASFCFIKRDKKIIFVRRFRNIILPILWIFIFIISFFNTYLFSSQTVLNKTVINLILLKFSKKSMSALKSSKNNDKLKLKNLFKRY